MGTLNGLAPNYLSSKFIQRGDAITVLLTICAILMVSLLFPCHVLTITKIALAIVVQFSGIVRPRPKVPHCPDCQPLGFRG